MHLLNQAACLKWEMGVDAGDSKIDDLLKDDEFLRADDMKYMTITLNQDRWPENGGEAMLQSHGSLILHDK